MKNIPPLPRDLWTWKYNENDIVGKCSITDGELMLSVALMMVETKEVPEVTAIRRALQNLALHPTTVEQYAISVKEFVGKDIGVTVVGTCNEHGPIEVTV